MTVLTKPVSEMKKKPVSTMDMPLITGHEKYIGTPGPRAMPSVAILKREEDRDPEKAMQMALRAQPYIHSATVCIFLAGLLVMSIGIIGGVYLYEQCAQKPIQRLRGFLNVPYNTSEGKQLYYQIDSHAAQQLGSHELNSKEIKKNGYFYEQFEADDAYERIDVPEFNGGRHGQFIHDFKINKTGIVDVDGKRCFVIPLDHDAVVFLPSFVIDIARRLSSRGTDVKVIVKTMRIAFPPLTDMNTVGANIARECAGMKVYSLVKAGPVFKRSAEEPVVFGAFAGKTMKVEILNYQEVVEAEKRGDFAVKEPQIS